MTAPNRLLHITSRPSGENSAKPSCTASRALASAARASSASAFAASSRALTELSFSSAS